MPRNVINVPALQAAVDEALEGRSPRLADRAPHLGAFLLRAAAEHPAVRPARRRRADPPWAQALFEKGEPLHRLDPRRKRHLRHDLGATVALLGAVAEIGSAAAAALLRGLSHRRDPDLDALREEAEAILRRDADRRLLARRDEVLRPPATVEGGGLTGTRCGTLRAVLRLGREAGNCLATLREQHRDVVEGRLDVWALRDGARLVAVLSADRGGRRVVEAKGPQNARLGLGDAMAVTGFCLAAGLAPAEDEGLLPDYAAPPLLGPVALIVEGRPVLYAEWPAAVRIDMAPSGRPDPWLDPVATLALAFDAANAPVAAILAGQDPREAIKGFGRRRLRRIVAAVALGQAAPTLVQHRLLALAA